MMRTSLLALSLCLLPALALGQDKPAEAAKPPAATAVAQALVKLRDAKQLGRLTQKRHYVMRRSGEVFLLTLDGTITEPMDGPGPWKLNLALRVKRFSRPGEIEFTYEAGPKGLSAVGMAEVRYLGTKKEERRGIQGTIGGGKLIGQKIRNGQADPNTFELGWTDNSLPAIFLWFVVPSLFDQGLPKELAPEIVIEEKLRPGRKFETASFVRTSDKPFKNKAGYLVHTFETKAKRDTTTVAVFADGPRKGVVLEVKVGTSRAFNLIDQKEYEQLKKDAPLIANESKAQALLRSLRYAQDTHKRANNTFAATLEALEAKNTYFAGKLKELEPVYLLLMRAAPDGSKWMAIAVPADPGKSGRRYFVTNQDGQVYASDKKLELDDSCAIPQGAKPVD